MTRDGKRARTSSSTHGYGGLDEEEEEEMKDMGGKDMYIYIMNNTKYIPSHTISTSFAPLSAVQH